MIKNYLMTGCLIFPVSLTCINNFEWYVKGSTEKIEEYTSATSFAYLEYFTNNEKILLIGLMNFSIQKTMLYFLNIIGQSIQIF